jgi:hypothetical protein
MYDGEPSRDPQPDRNGKPKPTRINDLKPTGIGEFIQAYPNLKPTVIDGLVRRGETANVIANPKVGKSWLAYGLGLSITLGWKWFDTYQTTPGRVLLIDNELHPKSIAGRIPTVASAMGITLDEYRDRFDVVSLRGRLTDYNGIGPLVCKLEFGDYSAVIVDAHYRMLLAGTSENDNAQVAGLYNLIDQYAAQTDAAWFLIHHSTKGSQSEKRTTDVGSGAGSQSRAADCHLVLREHEEAGYVVLDAAVRSFPPVQPAVLEWCFPIWLPVTHMNPDQLKGKLTKSEERQSVKDKEAILQIAGVLLKGLATASMIRKETGFGRDRTERLLGIMKSEAKVKCSETIAGGNKTVGYELCD